MCVIEDAIGSHVCCRSVVSMCRSDRMPLGCPCPYQPLLSPALQILKVNELMKLYIAQITNKQAKDAAARFAPSTFQQ
jgi:hypothetical protein